MSTQTKPSLTQRQQLIFDQITSQRTRLGYPATVREIAEALGIRSPNGVMCHIRALHAKGYVTWKPGLARTLVAVEEHNGQQQ